MVNLISYGITAIFILAALLFVAKNSKNKSKWGINLKRVYCPVCGTRQSIIRMPDSLSQAAWGGTTCPKCHTQLDKYGNVITKQ